VQIGKRQFRSIQGRSSCGDANLHHFPLCITRTTICNYQHCRVGAFDRACRLLLCSSCLFELPQHDVMEESRPHQQDPSQCPQASSNYCKLRSELLFKECLIHALGPYTHPQYLQLTDPKLKQAAERAIGILSAKSLR
jgi:hypothetical protein